tara:strand:- start:119 stop:886 length:768 start_codon:yes stop_codon:yes gene_type:complete
MKQCPICLESGKKSNTEHLPFKALYKKLDSQAQDNAATIVICKDCNDEKSVWDQEFLASYGHLLDLGRSEKAQRSLKNINEISNAMDFAMVASRASLQSGKAVAHVGGIPTDLISQWFHRCARGIYYFFENKPFVGSHISVIPKAIDNNIQASDFKYDSTVDNVHWINKACHLSLFRRSSNEPPVVSVRLVNPSNNRMFSIGAFMFENQEQINHFKNSEKVHSTKPMRTASARDIANIETKVNGYSYHGINKVKK